MRKFDFRKFILYTAIFFILLGGLIFLGQRLGIYGRIPGNLIISRDHHLLIVPLGSLVTFSCIIILFFYLFRRFRR